MKQKLFLIGFMGAGKTTLGKIIATQFNFRFVDTDNLIETEEKRSISQIFDENGESYFRKCESEILKKVCEQSETLVVATGGGIVENQGNMDVMLTSGFVVFLNTPLESSLARIKQQKNRPLASKNGVFQVEKLIERFQKRVPLYACAHSVFVPSGNVDVDAAELGLLWKNFND